MIRYLIMKIAIWILSGVLALAFVGAGGMKLATDRDALLQNPQMGWANDFSATSIKLIGAAEVAGGVGLILPVAIGVAPVLTPVAAGALAVLMAGAGVTHLNRSEPAAVPFVLAALSLVVLAGRVMLRRRGGTLQSAKA